MAQGAERGGVGLLDGQSGHGMILFVFVCFPWPLCQVWIFQKLEVVVNSRRQKGRFAISGFLSVRERDTDK